MIQHLIYICVEILIIPDHCYRLLNLQFQSRTVTSNGVLTISVATSSITAEYFRESTPEPSRCTGDGSTKRAGDGTWFSGRHPDTLINHRTGRAGGTRTRSSAGGPSGGTRCGRKGLKVTGSADGPVPRWFTGSSYLVDAAPAPVGIDFPKLGFHSGQSGCLLLRLLVPLRPPPPPLASVEIPSPR